MNSSGSEIAAARNALGLTQRQLADRAKISLATMKRAEHPRKGVSGDSLIKIALVLDLSVDGLVAA